MELSLESYSLQYEESNTKNIQTYDREREKRELSLSSLRLRRKVIAFAFLFRTYYSILIELSLSSSLVSTLTSTIVPSLAPQKQCKARSAYKYPLSSLIYIQLPEIVIATRYMTLAMFAPKSTSLPFICCCLSSSRPLCSFVRIYIYIYICERQRQNEREKLTQLFGVIFILGLEECEHQSDCQ